jgi:peptide/nickel transport system substrate-binding protein
MDQGRGRRRWLLIDACLSFAVAAIATSSVSCVRRQESAASSSGETTLRIGVAQLAATSSIAGLKQLSPLLTVESLARIREDGRMEPVLAEAWKLSEGGRLLTVKLRPGVTFTDGSPFDATTAAAILPGAVRATLGPVSQGIEGITASGTNTLEITFQRASMFNEEALEATLSKPGVPAGIGTGAYATVANSTTELRRNPDYYLGKPTIDRIVVSNHASVRAAWAEALRGNLDMLWEVSADALDSLEHSTTISTFVYTRHYQHVIILNANAPALMSHTTRRVLNEAIDRERIVRDALKNHGVVSSGPISPRYWALPSGTQPLRFDPGKTDEIVRYVAGQKGGRIRFTCLVTPNDELERIALEVKRQLAQFSIDMAVEEVSADELFRRGGRGEYEAILTDILSGPTLMRPYAIWRTDSPLNWGKFGNASVDLALERVRNAPTEDQFIQAAAGLQKAFAEDPPAIFLSWSVRARAVSTRFVVPPVEAGRDVLSTLRLWKPAPGELRAGSN